MSDTPAALIVAAVSSATAAGFSGVVAWLNYRSQGARITVYFRLYNGEPAEGFTVDVSNSGRSPVTILRVGLCHGSRLRRREKRYGHVWTYMGPTQDGNSQMHRLDALDAARWRISPDSGRSAIDDVAPPPGIRAFVQLADGKLRRSRRLPREQRPVPAG